MRKGAFNAARYKNFTIFSLNIANPSLLRAERQVQWFIDFDADVYVLTECKGSMGCLLIQDYFLSNGYDVAFPKLKWDEYGVLIASKHSLLPSHFSGKVNYLSSRVVSVKVSGLDFEITGIYVPSRGTNNIRKERKKRFIRSLHSALRTVGTFKRTIFCGDFNIIEPGHIPQYSVFENWEYSCYNDMTGFKLVDVYRHLYPKSSGHSWIGRGGNGYRYDYCFVSEDIADIVQDCYYLHEPREKRLSDHAGIVTQLIMKA